MISQIKVGTDTVLTHSPNQADVSITFVPQRTNQFRSLPRTLSSEENGSVTYLALPLSWLTTYTVYLNLGRETHDYVRSGLCINSSGSGDRQWHCSGFWSDDYMYNQAIKHAYILGPDPTFRRRIEVTGRTLIGRYNRLVPEQN